MKNTLKSFEEVRALIEFARRKASKVVNQSLIELYWNIGHYISDKIKQDGWGNSTVKSLSDFIQKTEPKSKGFSSQSLWRMKQF